MLQFETRHCTSQCLHAPEKKTSLPPVNWRWVEEGGGYVGHAPKTCWHCTNLALSQ
jgi:hypothetical protein